MQRDDIILFYCVCYLGYHGVLKGGRDEIRDRDYG